MHVETCKNRVFIDNGANGTHDDWMYETVTAVQNIRLMRHRTFYRKPILTQRNTRTHTATACRTCQTDVRECGFARLCALFGVRVYVPYTACHSNANVWTTKTVCQYWPSRLDFCTANNQRKRLLCVSLSPCQELTHQLSFYFASHTRNHQQHCACADCLGYIYSCLPDAKHNSTQITDYLNNDTKTNNPTTSTWFGTFSK